MHYILEHFSYWQYVRGNLPAQIHCPAWEITGLCWETDSKNMTMTLLVVLLRTSVWTQENIASLVTLLHPWYYRLRWVSCHSQYQIFTSHKNTVPNHYITVVQFYHYFPFVSFVSSSTTLQWERTWPIHSSQRTKRTEIVVLYTKIYSSGRKEEWPRRAGEVH